MVYPRKLLHDREHVALDLHPHWVALVAPVVALVVAIVAGVAALVVSDGGTTSRTALGWMAIVVLAGAIVWAVVRYLRWANTNVVITTDRVILRTGVLAKSGIEVPVDRVNSVQYSQSALQRLVGAGDVVVESGGDDGHQRFDDIRNPRRMQREIHAQMEVNRRRRGAARTGGGVADQLERLEAMLDRGTLDTGEFELHKSRLLRPGR